MKDLETVEGYSITSEDPLYAKQKSDVAKMRASILVCSDNPDLAKQALQNITVLRIYHQVSRIVKYLDMMDKIEAKLYKSIDRQLERLSDDSPATLMMLLEVQERLQKLMIGSQKLLQPYMDLSEYTALQPAATTNDNNISAVFDSKSREKLRSSAQAVLLELNVV